MTPGTLVADRFLVGHLANSGGMGAVFRAQDQLTGEPVAIKVTSVRADGAERFLREARLLAELTAPGIVKYIAHGVTPAGEAYIAMEWLDGEDLSDRLARAGLTAEESVEIAAQTAAALQHAHGRGIVHRDLKPSNLFLVNRRVQELRVLDFGIARHAATAHIVTRTGSLVGTPGYMSPEQARGARDLDASSDVFSLGCILFECIAGRPVFESEQMIALLTKILFEEPPLLEALCEGIAPSLSDLVARMLSKDPKGRPRNAEAVSIELTKLGPLGVSRPAEPSQRLALTGSEQRVLSLVLVGAQREEPTAATLTPLEVSTATEGLRAAVAPLGGVLERLADGSVVVTLMAGLSAEDAAASAARVALALRDELPGRSIALCTGRGEIAGALPLGEVVDRAARLLGGPARIQLDEVTAGLLDARFEVTKAREVLGVREPVEGTRTLLGKPTPCVGRDRELATLLVAWSEVIGEPVARAVVVTAPPGVGKSRVRAELVKRLREQTPEAEIWLARADPMRAGAPFGLLAQALRATSGIRVGEPDETSRRKLSLRVARRVAESERSRVTAFLGELVGVPFPDARDMQLAAARQDRMLMGDQMRRAFEDLLDAETAAHPLVIVLDDLHWGDLSSIKFIDAALRNLAERPLMVAAFGRPQIHELFGLPWAERGAQEIRLVELSRKASERLVLEVLGDRADPATLARIVSTAGGNAFFLEELIRAVAEGRGAALPGTVLAIVQSRLEVLPLEARRVLRAASVFGQSFWAGGVHALLGTATRAGSLADSFAHFAELELISKRATTKLAGEEEYSFRHSIVHEAAYEMLTPGDRTLGHRLAAEWLQKVGERDALVIAEHYERGAVPEKAALAYRRACEQALEGNDLASAISRAAKGVACGAAGAERGALRLAQAEAHLWRGEFGPAEEHATDAMRLLPPGSPEHFVALGTAAYARGTLSDVDGLLAAVLELRQCSPQNEAALGAYAVAIANAATRLLYLGRHADVDDLLQALERSIEGKDWEPLSFAGWVQEARSTLAMARGDMAECLRWMEIATTSFETAGDLRSACRERGHIGYAYAELGVHDAAEPAFVGVIEAGTRMGLSHVVAGAKHNLGRVLSYQGRLAEAELIERQALAELLAQGDTRLCGSAQYYLANILVLAGRLEEAEKMFRVGIETLSGSPPEAVPAAYLASLLVAGGRIEEARTLSERAMSILTTYGRLEEGETTVRLAHIEVLRARGLHDEAALAVREGREKVLEAAAKIQNETFRRCFLEQIPENARMMSLGAV